MGIFKKKEKQNKEQEFSFDDKRKNISKNLYRVILKEKTGNTTSTIANLVCKRWFEEDSEIPFLRNDKAGFLEVMPEVDVTKFDVSSKDIETKITELKAKLEDINEMEDPQEIIDTYGNPKNLQFKLLILEAKKHALKYDSRVYQTFALNGEKEFTFIRDGSHFIPECVDVETYTKFYPPDSKKKTFAFTHRNKSLKLGMGQKLMTTALAATWIFGLFFLMGTGYLMFQSWEKYTTNDINLVRVECLKSAQDIVTNVERQSNEITKIYEAINKDLNKPQTVIDGVIPQ